MKIEKVLILETNKGTFEGREWQSLIGRVDGKLLKFKVDATVDLSDMEDKTVDLEVEIQGSASQPAYLKVKAVK